MADAKLLRPPHVWIGKSLVEDRRYVRWTLDQIRAMKNGTYDWSTHTERSAGQ